MTRLPWDEFTPLIPTAPGHWESLAEALELSETDLSKGLAPTDVRELLLRRGFRYPEKNIVFHCLKGGASKTTLAYNCAFRLAQLGARTLLVDLDKQANATHSFGLEPTHGVFVDAVTGKRNVQEMVIFSSETLSILPSSLENARLEMELIHRRINPRSFYRTLLEPVRSNFDIVIFDLPPDLNHNTYLSTLAADLVCVPVNPDEYSVLGMRMTLESIESIQREFPDLQQEVLVIWSRFDAREKSSASYLAEKPSLNGARVFPNIIRSDIVFRHAQSRGKSVFQTGGRSNAREDVALLARELLGLDDTSSKGNA